MENLKKIITNYNLTQDKYNLLLKKLKRYKKNHYMFKSAFIRAGFSKEFIDLLFDDLKNLGYLEKNYTVYSPFTQERQNFVTNNIKEIPDYFECETTDEEFNTSNHIRSIYKVTKNLNTL